MPSFTIISCATAVIEAGGKPVLVDCYPDTWCMNIEQVESKISKRTKAILVVHMFGHPVEMDPIIKIVRKKKLFLIEDAAESLGSCFQWRSHSKSIAHPSQDDACSRLPAVWLLITTSCRGSTWILMRCMSS